MAEAKQMTEQRFLDHIYEGYRAGQRYCFILGAGASRTSGIRTGEELMREWRKFLIHKGKEYTADCARELGIKPERYEYLLDESKPLRNDDYFTLFDLRYAGNPNAAYAFLEKEMEQKFPSYGYFPLAMLLAHTENRLVITTNFDSLVEDALYTYTSMHPLSVGHESLAPYMENDTRRPVIAKVHRDLLLQPMNREEEMQRLAKEWERPLRNALQKYIPIVIGYAGGDHTLMTLLQTLSLKGLYWCHVGEMKEGAIQDLVAKQNGYLVKILGFDEVMFQLGQKFEEITLVEDGEEYVRKQAEVRCKRYRESLDAIRRKYQARKPESMQDQTPEEKQTEEELTGIVQAIEAHDARQEGDTENPGRDYAVGAQIAALTGENARAYQLYSQAIDLAPNTADYYDRRSTALYKMEKYEEAMEDENRAIDLEPDNAKYYSGRAVIFHAMGEYKKALEGWSKAIELEPKNSRYWKQRGVTLHEMGQYEQALKDKSKAIELEPENARYWQQRGVTLHAMGHYKDALADINKAIDLDPKNAEYYDSRAVTLHSLGQYEKALKDRTKAIDLDPENARYWNQRSVTLHAMGRYKEALADVDRAVELEPENAKYYNGRSATLHAMGRYEEALKDANQAVELEPENAKYYDSRSATLHTMKRYEEALIDCNKAIELAPKEPRYYRDRAVTLRKLGRQEQARADEKKARELEEKN